MIGSSCAGKSTLADSIAKKMGITHVELDSLFWEPGWKEAATPVFRARVQEAIAGDAWVVDGNYTSRVQDLLWPRAELIIWLDPPLRTILTRFLRRSFTRAWRGEVLWDGCRESLRNSIFKRNSLLIWILTTHRSQRARYLAAVQAGNYPGIKFLVLRGDGAVASFLSKLRPSSL
ncbi:MAG: adenylate kinase [Proteobacteria bacterium]|nr:MAG: adenylate kinase [Pseudomonadota bacterium]